MTHDHAKPTKPAAQVEQKATHDQAKPAAQVKQKATPTKTTATTKVKQAAEAKLAPGLLQIRDQETAAKVCLVELLSLNNVNFMNRHMYRVSLRREILQIKKRWNQRYIHVCV